MKVFQGDALFRRALRDNGFIPRGSDDRPRDWNCWITNLVKCPCRTHFWRHELEKNRKEDTLQKSADFLNDEVGAISPRMVVMMGREVESCFETYASRLEDLPKQRRWVYHYAHKFGEAKETEYEKRLHEVAEECWKVAKK